MSLWLQYQNKNSMASEKGAMLMYTRCQGGRLQDSVVSDYTSKISITDVVMGLLGHLM